MVRCRFSCLKQEKPGTARQAKIREAIQQTVDRRPMTAAEIIPYANSLLSGVYAGSELPQRGSVADAAFGVGWWELDEIFKFYPGQFVVVTGIAGSGKSTFLLNVVCKLAREQGINSFLYVPENEGYVIEQLRLIWGQDKQGFDYFLDSQVFFQTSVKSDDEEPHTMKRILTIAAAAVQAYKIELVVIDPWNELERARNRDELLTDYIGRCIIEIKNFVRTMDVSVVVIAHPTKAVNENGGRVPRLADIEGSMNWFNKCDNGLVIARSDDKDETRVISAKVRQIGAGRRGECYFTVDAKTGIFTPMKGAVTP
jgi:twinkle protein